MTDVLTCTVAFSVDDTPRSIRQLLFALDPILHAGGDPIFRLDLSQCRYLGPDAAAILLAMVLEGRARGQTFHTDLPVTPPALDAFCAFSGLKHWLCDGEAPQSEHPQCETVPLRQLFDARFTDVDPILRLVERKIDVDTDSAETLRYCFNEVLQNVKDHARSRIGAVCCARFLTSRREVRAAIVDRGEGIATTLRPRYPDISDARSALRHVIQGGFTAQSRETNSGAGISYLWSNVKRLRGSIFIITEDGIASTRGDEDRIEHIDPPFPGTGVFFTLPVIARSQS